MCENEEYKKKYLSGAWKDCYIFDDMRALGTGRCFDYRSQRMQDVPKVTCLALATLRCEVDSYQFVPTVFSLFSPLILSFVLRIGDAKGWFCLVLT